MAVVNRTTDFDDSLQIKNTTNKTKINHNNNNSTNSNNNQSTTTK